MSDTAPAAREVERMLYAGDLSTDHLGRRIGFTTPDGVRIESELRALRYVRRPSPRGTEARAVLEMYRVLAEPSLHQDVPHGAFDLPPTTLVDLYR